MTTKKRRKRNTNTRTNLVGQLIAMNLAFHKIAGSADGALYLAYAVYNTTSTTSQDKLGFTAHDVACIEVVTGLSPEKQNACRKILRERDILEEIRTYGVYSGRLAIRVNLVHLEEQVKLLSSGQSSPFRRCNCRYPVLAEHAAIAAAVKSVEKPNEYMAKHRKTLLDVINYLRDYGNTPASVQDSYPKIYPPEDDGDDLLIGLRSLVEQTRKIDAEKWALAIEKLGLNAPLSKYRKLLETAPDDVKLSSQYRWIQNFVAGRAIVEENKCD